MTINMLYIKMAGAFFVVWMIAMISGLISAEQQFEQEQRLENEIPVVRIVALSTPRPIQIKKPVSKQRVSKPKKLKIQAHLVKPKQQNNMNKEYFVK